MHKLVVSLGLHSVILGLALSASLRSIPDAYAQTKTSQSAETPPAEEEIEELDSEQLDSIDDVSDEPPPKPEYPYPGAEEEGFGTNQRPKSAPPKTSRTPRPVAPLNTERPARVNDDGEYFYDTKKLPDPGVKNPSNVHTPARRTEDGQYFYDTRPKTAPIPTQKQVEQPLNTNAEGEYYYSTETSPKTGAASIRFGLFSPPDIENSKTGADFDSVYTGNDVPVVFGDYEWALSSAVGKLGLKFGSGIFVANGTGTFLNDNGRRPDDKPQEKFTFLMFPNQLTVAYRFQYAENQVFVPYVEGGGGFFTFAEIRDDSKPPKVGGALVTVAAGGANILLDWMDRTSMRQLDVEYGINHVWLTGEFRVIKGLNPNFDFTSRAITLGFLLEF